MHLRQSIAVAVAGSSVTLGCTSFSTVRSAAVTTGSAFTVQAAVSSPPGDVAAWFWSIDCAQECNHPVAGGDFTYAYGRGMASRQPYTIGAGLNGLLPYVEGYVQLDTSRTRPFGVGVRAGLPVLGAMQHQVYARYDVALSPGVRWLWNPGIVYHSGNSQNRENPGTFLGLVQGVGVAIGKGARVFTPSVALVWGRAERRSYGAKIGPESRLFGSAGLSVGFRHRER